jgi:hypothetical protein
MRNGHRSLLKKSERKRELRRHRLRFDVDIKTDINRLSICGMD